MLFEVNGLVRTFNDAETVQEICAAFQLPAEDWPLPLRIGELKLEGPFAGEAQHPVLRARYGPEKSAERAAVEPPPATHQMFVLHCTN